MLTRIKIHGFKSLLNCELYFNNFTCIAGANAVGKSNFFDALSFLSNLADKTIVQSAKYIRGGLGDAFFKSGSDIIDEMYFEADMLIPHSGIDDLGQRAESTTTSVRYILHLKLNEDSIGKQPIEIIKEELLPISQTETKKNLFFNKDKKWLNSVLKDERHLNEPFISTEETRIKLHQDGKNGRVSEFIKYAMPRTLLSTVTAESPTAFLVRHEMRNWMMFQFEPSALSSSDTIYEVNNAKIASNGLNIPATIFRLQTEKKEEDICQKLTNRLKDLVENIKEIKIDKDEIRDLLTLQLRFKNGLTLAAPSLSEGTLRFLGLAVLLEDSSSSRLICLEEPENGIHPKKITEVIQLLEDMATDFTYSVDENNPLRQVIINTHSPIIVQKVMGSSLYLAKNKECYIEKFNKKVVYTGFSALEGTWKTEKANIEKTTLGETIAYLDKTTGENAAMTGEERVDYSTKKSKQEKTVQEHVHQLKLKF